VKVNERHRHKYGRWFDGTMAGFWRGSRVKFCLVGKCNACVVSEKPKRKSTARG